jgi:hypothetical protein
MGWAKGDTRASTGFSASAARLRREKRETRSQGKRTEKKGAHGKLTPSQKGHKHTKSDTNNKKENNGRSQKEVAEARKRNRKTKQENANDATVEHDDRCKRTRRWLIGMR